MWPEKQWYKADEVATMATQRNLSGSTRLRKGKYFPSIYFPIILKFIQMRLSLLILYTRYQGCS